MEWKEVIENLKYLISEDCTDTQFDYADEIEIAIRVMESNNVVERSKIDKAIEENEKLKLENATLKKSNEMLQKSIEKVRNEINETCTFWNEDWDGGFNSAVDIFKKHLGGDWE